MLGVFLTEIELGNKAKVMFPLMIKRHFYIPMNDKHTLNRRVFGLDFDLKWGDYIQLIISIGCNLSLTSPNIVTGPSTTVPTI